MKKVLSLILAITFCLGLSVSAFASGETSEGGPAQVYGVEPLF